jgi:tetratricopeptide (TPR) repeat protein
VNKAVLPAIILMLLVFSCPSAPPPLEDEIGDRGNAAVSGGSPEADLRIEVESGSFDSLGRAAELLENAELRSSEQGRALGLAGGAIVRAVYPGAAFPELEAPANSSYARIIREAAAGNYTAPAAGARDLLEYVLPFLAFYTEDASARLNRDGIRAALPHLERAARLNAGSALVPLFRGFALEKTGDSAGAAAAYRRALELDRSAYAAELGLIRLLQSAGTLDEALTRLTALQSRYPESRSVRKQLARLYAEQRNWQRAGTLITAILGENSRDGEFLLLRAKILLEQGLFQQAQQPLDAYANSNSANRQYVLLRSRLQAEGLRNREGAINLLRPLYRSDPDDAETALYLALLLMESGRANDAEEGRNILNRFLNSANASPEALSLAAQDSVKRENWREAKPYLDRLLAQRRTSADLLNAWKTERALGNASAALAHARELYNRGNPDDETVSAYVLSLVDTGRQSEAVRIIDERLGTVPDGVRKSRYYYLRSRTRNDDNAVLNDLRSALFEDPRNLDALTAMFEMYHRRQDERRAVYYLRQALVIAPDNPQLRRYGEEYRALLGN